jgi:uncharacterized DUF497 family protein
MLISERPLKKGLRDRSDEIRSRLTVRWVGDSYCPAPKVAGACGQARRSAGHRTSTARLPAGRVLEISRWRLRTESVVKWRVVDWRRFTPTDFEYDFDRDKLSQHAVTFDEAVECFFSDFEIRRNKQFRDRYQLVGSTFGGRKLKLIFQIKPEGVVRIITGWPL